MPHADCCLDNALITFVTAGSCNCSYSVDTALERSRQSSISESGYLFALVRLVSLWITDSIAISDGIWWISEEFTTGYELPLLPNVPIEEATFFVVTNLMCVQGVHLFLDALVHLQ